MLSSAVDSSSCLGDSNNLVLATAPLSGSVTQLRLLIDKFEWVELD